MGFDGIMFSVASIGIILLIVWMVWRIGKDKKAGITNFTDVNGQVPAFLTDPVSENSISTPPSWRNFLHGFLILVFAGLILIFSWNTYDSSMSFSSFINQGSSRLVADAFLIINIVLYSLYRGFRNKSGTKQ